MIIRSHLRTTPGERLLRLLDRPAPLRRLHDSGTGYKYPALLIYILNLYS